MALTLSIVVPVYNVKKYLDKCINSLLQQDLEKEDFEIILVDDGSTDGSGELCDSIEERESNVLVVHQQNQGLSGARNTGLNLAKGKYLQFVDSDDYLEKNVLSSIVRRMDLLNLEVLRFGYRRVKENEKSVNLSVKDVFSNKEEVLDGPNFLVTRLWYTCYACQFMFLRTYLLDNHLMFKPGILFEDTEWVPRVFRTALRVSSTDKVVYNYLMREGSITTGSARRIVDAQLSLVDDLKVQMNGWEDKRWHRGMISQIVVAMITLVGRELYQERKHYLEAIRIREVLPLSTFMAKKKAMRKIGLINISPLGACSLIHLLNF